ncbi:MAG: retention module-containing protein, partial [Halioglobus sp.]|nr:retention module-containing protein [Halioglobus sp.]
MANEAMATVTSISDSAQARNVNGDLRVLKAGDTLLEGETVITPNGGQVELALSDGNVLLVTDVPEMAITRDLVAETAAGPDESAVEDETVEAVLAALEAGEDLSEILDPTAAGFVGLEAPDGLQGDGHSFVRVGRIIESTDEFVGISGSGANDSVVRFADTDFMPVEAVNDVGTTEQAVPVIIDVQSNDIFQVGSNLIAVTDGSNGTVVINADNTVTYTPEDGFSGVDTFTYTALSANGNGEGVAT